jgi:LemA protein
MAFLILFLAIVFGPVILIVIVYNSLQRKKVNIEERWSSIGALLQKRNDLLPSLVETVRGYSGHEQNTFTEIARLRTSGSQSKLPSEYVQSESAIRQALANVVAVAEQYPNLKADKNFESLQNQLSQLENEIAAQRISYNDAVRSLNTTIVVFPNNFVASMFKIEKGQFFLENDSSSRPPSVKF